jgi:hypothetical protein
MNKNTKPKKAPQLSTLNRRNLARIARAEVLKGKTAR